MGTCCGLLYGRGLGSSLRKGHFSSLAFSRSPAVHRPSKVDCLPTGKLQKSATPLPTRGRFFSDRIHSEDRSPLWERDIFPQFPRGCLQASSLGFGVAVSKPGYIAVLEFQRVSFSGTWRQTSCAPFHSRLPATPQLPTHSDRFKLHRKPFPSSVHKVLQSNSTCVFATKAKICT